MVSIIMPTYNRAYIIERAIKSIIQQTYKDWELIIVDDASEDNTKEVIKKYLCRKIYYYANARNQGANESRNIGVEKSKGEFLAFLDSDNYWPANRLALQINMAKNCICERYFLYGKAQITDGIKIKVIPEKALTTEELKTKELHENVVDTNTILIKRALFSEIGGFNKDLPRLQDWELVLRMLYFFHIEGFGTEECLSFNEIQRNSIGKDNEKLIKAAGFLYKNYMCQYLDRQEIFNNLFMILDIKEVSDVLIQDTISGIASERPDLLYTALKYLKRIEHSCQRIEYRHQVSFHMEELLYEWQMKNLSSKEGTLFSEYFYPESKVKTIAVYGLGKLGMLFYNEVKKLPIKIKYGIDQEKQSFESLFIKRPNDTLEPVDWIVVTILMDSIKIKENLKKIMQKRS